MEWKLTAALVLGTSTTLVALAASAGAAPSLARPLSADLVLRPGVAQTGHPAVAPHALYGAFDASYATATDTLAWKLRYKGLSGNAFRVVVRSRWTGRIFAVLCDPCEPALRRARGNEGLPVRVLSGAVRLDLDTAFLVSKAGTFVQVDTTAYPGGEIGGPILPAPQEVFLPPSPPGTAYGPAPRPRCC
jgi:hypothetical protein